MSAHIKPWTERVLDGSQPNGAFAREAEIAELRAALAVAQNVIDVLRHYPDFDDGNNAYSVMMDQVLAGETPALLTSLDALAAGRKPPAAPLPQQAASCPVCKGNDADMPCAYPSEGLGGCLRDARLAQQAAGDGVSGD